MQNSVTKNNALGFTEDQWSQLINANGLLIMWFIEWNNREWHKIPDTNILEFFAKKYQQSAGCEPWPMGGKVSLDGKYVSKDDDDLDGRKNLTLIKSLLDKGYDLDKGAILLKDEDIFHGADAINTICQQINNPSSNLL